MLRAPAHASAKLMHLRQTEALGLLDQHHGRVGNVHADFDHRGRHQDLNFAALKFLHGGFFIVRRKLAVQQPDLQIRIHHARKMFVHLLRGLHGLRFRFFDHRIHHVGLPPRIDLLFEKAVDLLDASLLHMLGDDGLASGRHLIDDAHVQIAVDRERERARDGRRRHHQHVRMTALLHQFLPLLHAEAMLLIDNRQAELLKFDVGFEQRVRSDHHLGPDPPPPAS